MSLATVWFSATPVVETESVSSCMRAYNCGRLGREKGKRQCEGGVGKGNGTVGFFVLLVFPHSFDTDSTGNHFVGEAALIVGLILVLIVDLIMSLLGIV